MTKYLLIICYIKKGVLNMKKIILSIISIFIIITILIVDNSKVINKADNNKIKVNNNLLSMMLETEANSGKYEMTTSSSWPTDGYVFNSSLSKCENGGKLSWDNENKKVIFDGNNIDKCYVYFDVYVPLRYISEVCSVGGNLSSCITNLANQSSPSFTSIYHHDGTLENGINDDSYRYAGASDAVNNFVCFGSNAEECPTDNLYRIIGVIDDRVKLIKYDYATSDLLGTDGDYYDAYRSVEYIDGSSYYKGSNYANIAVYNWNYNADTSNNSNTWSTSLLNKTNLNTNFINNIGNTWSSKIATTTWKVGGNTLANIVNVVPSETYQNEIINPDSTGSTDNATEYSAKVGLVYVSDYEFAASPSAWTLVGYNQQYPTKSYKAATTSNWMYMGLNEWTISRESSTSDQLAIRIVPDGMTVNGFTRVYYGVRPVFSLLPSITYAGGTGSMSSPIRIN